MGQALSRRSALGLGVGVGAGAVFGTSGTAFAADASTQGAEADARTAVQPRSAASVISAKYKQQKSKVGGTWHSHVAAVDADGTLGVVVDDDADTVTHGYSVQKLAVATAVMDKVDRGELSLGQKLDLPASIILGGSGIYHLHSVWGDDITIANFLTAMLLVSDNTAVRMCGRVVPALEINAILAAKGFTNTRVEPVANPNRFYLGTTTAREMHDLLWRLANKTLLSPASCDFLLNITRWINGYHDGIRRNMSSVERARIATKYGADYNTAGASRHEAGIMFSADGAPMLTYAFFADGLGQQENYGATHPAVEAHAVLGRTMFDAINGTAAPAHEPRSRPREFHQVDGG